MGISLGFDSQGVYVVLFTECNENSQQDGDHSFYLKPADAITFAQQIIDMAREALVVINDPK